MGIESDKLVFDYLSRVGDLAQTALPASDRMRLVAKLRNDIDSARDKSAADSPAAVRRILGRLGTPDDIVATAAGGGVPAQAARPAPGVDFGKHPAPGAPGVSPPPSVNDVLAGFDPGEPDGTEWWRTTSGETGLAGEGALGSELSAAGWTGGLIMSEFQPPAPPPPTPEQLQAERDREEAAAAAVEAVAAAPPAKRPFRIPRIRLRPLPAAVAEEAAPAPARRGIPTGPVEVIAAVALVAGAVLTNIVLLGIGWILAYTTRGISRKQAQFAALVLPGTTVVGAIVWFWGRVSGHWGPALVGNDAGAAFTADLPGIARVAAVVSALYLLWRGVLKRG